MESVDPGGALSDAEIRELTRLLARFASHDLDQWENWRLDTSYGPVFMSVSRELLPGWPEDAFTTIWPMPAQLTEDTPGVGQCGGRTTTATGVRSPDTTPGRRQTRRPS